MVRVTREEMRSRVLASSGHRKKIGNVLRENAMEAAFRTYCSMSMHSCHFTHIAMVIWRKAQSNEVPDKVLATGWGDMLMKYAKGLYPSGENAGQQLLKDLVRHGAKVLGIKETQLMTELHPLDRDKLEGGING